MQALPSPAALSAHRQMPVGPLGSLKPQEEPPHVNPLSNLRSSTLRAVRGPLQKPAPLRAGNTPLTPSLKKNPDLLKILLPRSSLLFFSRCPICSRQADDCWSYLTARSKSGDDVKPGTSQLLHRRRALSVRGGCWFPASAGRSPLGRNPPKPGSAGPALGHPQPRRSSARAGMHPRLGQSPTLQSHGQTPSARPILTPTCTLSGVIPNPIPHFFAKLGVGFFFFGEYLFSESTKPH